MTSVNASNNVRTTGLTGSVQTQKTVKAKSETPVSFDFQTRLSFNGNDTKQLGLENIASLNKYQIQQPAVAGLLPAQEICTDFAFGPTPAGKEVNLKSLANHYNCGNVKSISTGFWTGMDGCINSGTAMNNEDAISNLNANMPQISLPS